ncbi:MAG TPA: SUMF1/EgtB/PvdO family nonheme iron enzyme [Saprospiraceae bacterium]|nr:SUMF1/EgtB/PvdO family nonheme iron enzyme [Saprospiraceae bacterium]HMP25601.1 SUMF1/EgtB/PvdO family nonheme iron enzyme [Saprospiraceae bacterium]
MKPWILCLFFALAASTATAQRTYAEAIAQGDAALRQGAYKIAIDKYFAAEAFDPAKKETVRAKVNAVFEKIEALRREAEDARKQAEAALAEVRLKNLSIFESFAALGKNQIYALDHAEALEKMKVAVEIDVDSKLKKQQLTEPIAELLYFFAEAGRRPQLARTAASLLLQLQPSATLEAHLKKCLQENWENRSQFTPLLKALPSYQTLQDRYYPRMVSIPLGEEGIFEMGSSPLESGHQSDEQLHKVRLSAYQMTETPTTFYQFALFCEAVERGIASRAPYWGLRGDHPAVNVNWYETAEYANWLNEQKGQSPSYTITKINNSDRNNKVRLDFLKWKVDWNKDSKGFRLPTEAEWELAAQGGVGASRTLYAGSDDLEEVGWYWQNSGDKPLDGDWDLNRIYDNNGRTHAVKGKKHNGLGIYDLSGNVYEWCWDWYDSDYYDECNQAGAVEKPTGPESSIDGRVFRGGSWYYFAAYCRAAFRDRSGPDYRNDNIGFRLVFVP